MRAVENPVLQWELLVNLRRPRAFWLLGGYLTAISLVVYTAWPEPGVLSLSNPEAARRLMNLLFLWQFLLAVLLAPSFASGAISGEKERKTYELLLTTPLPPSSLLGGKFLASLAPIFLLIFSSLPVVLLCLPLGGVSLLEALAAEFAILWTTVATGMIALACSSFFTRSIAALLTAYLIVLPLAMSLLYVWSAFDGPLAQTRIVVLVTIYPVLCAVVSLVLFLITRRRLLYTPDVGSEGQQVVDEEAEEHLTMQLVIRRDRFPDLLFAPAKRSDLMPEGTNPVFDKEMRSEVFSQGTLMLRVVIQLTVFVGLPLMFYCLLLFPIQTPWFITYAVLFCLMIGPVFSSGAITGERERQTLDLLLTTNLPPRDILIGKLLSALRVSGALTLLLVYLLVLGFVLSTYLREQPQIGLAYLAIIGGATVTTAMVGTLCSVMFRKTSTSLLAAYGAMTVLYFGPLALSYFIRTFAPDGLGQRAATFGESVSAFAAVWYVPLDFFIPGARARTGNIPLYVVHLAWTILVNWGVFRFMTWWFERRWRVAEG